MEGDYRLSNYSPSIGTGTLESPDTDLDGNPRPQPVETNPDMGAYENELGERFIGARTMYQQQGLKKEMGYQLLVQHHTAKSRCSLEWRHGDCISRDL